MIDKKVLIVFLISVAVSAPVSFVLIKSKLEEKQLLTKHACIDFYNEQQEISDDHFEANRDPLIESLMGQDLKTEAWTMALTPLKAQMAIGNRVNECAPYDDRYFQTENDLCRSKTISADLRAIITLMEEEPEYYTRNITYCDAAFERSDLKFLFTLFYDYAVGILNDKNFKTALTYIDKIVEKHPDKKFVLAYAAKLYEIGGFGIKKSDKKAFELMLEASESDTNGQIYCELNNYYKNGTGAQANIEKADYWLKKYKEKNTEKDCKAGDYNFLKQPSRFNSEQLTLREKCIRNYYAPEIEKCKNEVDNKKKRLVCYSSANDRSYSCRTKAPAEEWPALLIH